MKMSLFLQAPVGVIGKFSIPPPKFLKFSMPPESGIEVLSTNIYLITDTTCSSLRCLIYSSMCFSSTKYRLAASFTYSLSPDEMAPSFTGLKISFTGPSDKMSDDFEFGSDICMMMSDDLQFGTE
jgi:hypothetical protein